MPTSIANRTSNKNDINKDIHLDNKLINVHDKNKTKRIKGKIELRCSKLYALPNALLINYILINIFNKIVFEFC